MNRDHRLSKDKPYPSVGDVNCSTVVRRAVVDDDAHPTITTLEPSGDTAIALDSEALANFVAHGLTTLVALRPYVEELWRRFDALRPGETIHGCTTKKQFCETVLHRTPRTVRYMLDGGNPVCKRSRTGETVSRLTEEAKEPNLIADATPQDREEQLFKYAEKLYRSIDPVTRDRELQSLAKRLLDFFMTDDARMGARQ